MKRKFLAILLCFVLTIPFALTSCYGNNWLGDIDGSEKTSFYDEIKDTYKKAEAVSEATSLTIDGTFVSSSDSFLFAYTNESTETHAVAKYTVYDIKTGTGLVSIKLEREYLSGSFSSLYKDVSASFGDGFFVIAGTKANDMIEYTVYNKNGTEILKGTNVSYQLLDEKGILFDNKLYSVDESGTPALVKDLTDSKLTSIIDQLEKYGERYLYVSGTTAYVFDTSFDILYVQHLNSTPSSTHLNTSGTMFLLNNGNILYQENILLCQYNPTINHNEYDYVLGGSCYRVNTCVFNIISGKYTKINLPYLIQTIHCESEYVNSLPYGYENLALAKKIDGGELVYTNGSIYAYLLMDNNAKATETDIASYTVLGENRYSLYDGFTYHIYDENDKLIGKLNSITYVNNELIVTPSAIYNHSLDVVCTFDGSVSIIKIFPSSVLTRRYDSDSNSYKYELVLSDKTVELDVNPDSIRTMQSCVFATESKEGANGESSFVLTIYSEKGEVIFESEIFQGASVYTGENGLVRTTSKDGKILLITVK